jgi:hypothetical protein
MNDELLLALEALILEKNVELYKIRSTTLKNDMGELDIINDPMQTKSFSRGRSFELVTSINQLIEIINKHRYLSI